MKTPLEFFSADQMRQVHSNKPDTQRTQVWYALENMRRHGYTSYNVDGFIHSSLVRELRDLGYSVTRHHSAFGHHSILIEWQFNPNSI